MTTWTKKIKHALTPRVIRKKYYEYLTAKEYNRVKNLPEKEYENYLCEKYKIMMNRFAYSRGLTMDFENPTTYTQKQQWMKLYEQSAEKSMLSDKYAVREHVKNVIGEEYLIPLITVNGKDRFFDANEIDFDQLPNQFVMKCNHGSHYNIIVKDKSALSKKEIKKYKKQLNLWLKEHYAFTVGLELVYEQIEPCIIIEKYMAMNDDLPDYKFMCFSGEVKYVWVDQGRFQDHRRTLFDLEYKKMPFNMHAHNDVIDDKKPENFEEMIELSKKLCGSFPYVRVDLYNVEGKIYFGELTFSSGAGYQAPNPASYDEELGKLIQIDTSVRDQSYRYRNQ